MTRARSRTKERTLGPSGLAARRSQRDPSQKGGKRVRGTRLTPRCWLHGFARVGPEFGRDADRRRRQRGLEAARFPRPRRERRRSVPPSLQVRAVSANDHGVATRVVEPDARAAAGGAGAGHAATFASTEHFNLQTARALTVSESNGRASIYLAALSSNLIALAFIGQMSRLGVAFYAFALVLLPVLAFVGTVTFVRLVQSSIEDIAYAHRIALVRSYYLRISPELEPYLIAPRGTRMAEPSDGEKLAPSAWQLTLTAAGMVAVVNSVVVAACAGLVVEAAGVHSVAIPVGVGAVIGAAAFTLHERHHRRARDAYSPEAIDRSAILISPPQPADA